MIQVFLWGAHKYPRELTWVAGVLLFLCTLGMAFTGQILRWDQDAYWGLGIGASIISRAPYRRRSALVHVLLGGPIIAGRTLSRFFTAARVRGPGPPDRARRPAPLACAPARHQRVADARPAGRPRDLPEALRGRDRRRTACRSSPTPPARTWWAMGVVVLAVLLCAAIFGPNGPARGPESHHHRHRAEAGLLLPGALRPLRAAAALDRDSHPAGRPPRRHRVTAGRCRSSRGPGRRAGSAGRWRSSACS